MLFIMGQRCVPSCLDESNCRIEGYCQTDSSDDVYAGVGVK
jgi:hypothetical protein